MQLLLSTVKGLHPGIYLARELKKRKLAKGKFALQIGEYPQTFTAVTKGNRRMNPGLSLKIEEALSMPEGLLMILQVYFDLEAEKQKSALKTIPASQRIRPALFWDINYNKLDWKLQQNAIIRRVLDRGNSLEREEIVRMYGEKAVQRITSMKDHVQTL